MSNPCFNAVYNGCGAEFEGGRETISIKGETKDGPKITDAEIAWRIKQTPGIHDCLAYRQKIDGTNWFKVETKQVKSYAELKTIVEIVKKKFEVFGIIMSDYDVVFTVLYLDRGEGVGAVWNVKSNQ